MPLRRFAFHSWILMRLQHPNFVLSCCLACVSLKLPGAAVGLLVFMFLLFLVTGTAVVNQSRATPVTSSTFILTYFTANYSWIASTRNMPQNVYSLLSQSRSFTVFKLSQILCKGWLQSYLKQLGLSANHRMKKTNTKRRAWIKLLCTNRLAGKLGQCTLIAIALNTVTMVLIVSNEASPSDPMLKLRIQLQRSVHMPRTENINN